MTIKTCIYCAKGYKPRIKTQKTCGEWDCKAQLKRQAAYRRAFLRYNDLGRMAAEKEAYTIRDEVILDLIEQGYPKAIVAKIFNMTESAMHQKAKKLTQVKV